VLCSCSQNHLRKNPADQDHRPQRRGRPYGVVRD
jgi:hypothetical protein